MKNVMSLDCLKDAREIERSINNSHVDVTCCFERCLKCIQLFYWCIIKAIVKLFNIAKNVRLLLKTDETTLMYN